MYQRKMMEDQILEAGVRLGDSCSIFPLYGKKKAFTLKNKKIDLISSHYRPQDLSMSYIELPKSVVDPFHYRLELDQSGEKNGRFVLKTIEGRPFWLNGLAAKEAYVERQDRLYIDENKINFLPFNLGEMVERNQEHPVLSETNLLQSSLTILISGETGTGKTHLAQKIHAKSGRRGPLVAINLSSYNPQLIESELFGHKRGAFTGAIKDKIGALLAAQEGTLFIDEIDSLPLDLQTKLLTFLDNKRFRPVGDYHEISVNTRLIFASGRCLSRLTEQGLFRRDLYYRLKSGHTVELSSLRNDPQRIKQICQQFSLKHSLTISKRLVDFYQTLVWAGNLRQLLGHLDKKRVLSRGSKLDFDSFDEELLLQSSDLMTLDATEEIVPMEEFKISYTKKALGRCDGNIAMTAKKLGVNVKTIRTLLQKG